jgi:enamine deaminase RidA (YjgF/YER057c/UK114 family)
MVTRKVVGSWPAGVSRPFSRAIRVDAGSMTMLFISGIAATDADGNTVHRGDAGAQARAVLERMRKLLESEGAAMRDVTKVTIFLKEMADYPAINLARAEYFPQDPPASSAVEARMIRDDFLVEIEAIAVIGRGAA